MADQIDHTAEAVTWPADPALTDDPKDFGPDGYQYGFVSDMTTGVIAYVFGMIPFHDYDAAMHTCSKSYMYEYSIVRRKSGEDWQKAKDPS